MRDRLRDSSSDFSNAAIIRGDLTRCALTRGALTGCVLTLYDLRDRFLSMQFVHAV